MGDGGSYLVGFLVAVAMLMATFAGNSDRPHAVLAPLCAMAVPLYDMATVLWIRIREGRSPFVGDRSHFSHRLVELGLSRTQAVLTIYLVTATCGLAAILLTHVTVVQAVMVLGIVLCMLLLVVILESTGWRKDERVIESRRASIGARSRAAAAVVEELRRRRLTDFDLGGRSCSAARSSTSVTIPSDSVAVEEGRRIVVRLSGDRDRDDRLGLDRLVRAIPRGRQPAGEICTPIDTRSG